MVTCGGQATALQRSGVPAPHAADVGHVDPIDPIDREAAQIDARSEDAPEEIAELIEHARAVGRDIPREGAAPG